MFVHDIPIASTSGIDEFRMCADEQEVPIWRLNHCVRRDEFAKPYSQQLDRDAVPRVEMYGSRLKRSKFLENVWPNGSSGAPSQHCFLPSGILTSCLLPRRYLQVFRLSFTPGFYIAS